MNSRDCKNLKWAEIEWELQLEAPRGSAQGAEEPRLVLSLCSCYF